MRGSDAPCAAFQLDRCKCAHLHRTHTSEKPRRSMSSASSIATWRTEQSDTSPLYSSATAFRLGKWVAKALGLGEAEGVGEGITHCPLQSRHHAISTLHQRHSAHTFMSLSTPSGVPMSRSDPFSIRFR